MRRSLSLTLWGTGVLMLTLVAACGGGKEAPTATPAPRAATPAPAAATTAPSAGAYQATTVGNGGAIAGSVKLKGTASQLKPLVANKDTEVCGASKANETLLVSAKGDVQFAVVSIKDIDRGKAIDIPAVAKLDQKECVYAPHVLLGKVGGSLEVHNSDPLLHNVHSFAFDNPPVNRAQPKGSASIRSNLSAKEIIKVGCDIHGWMTAWVVAAEHPYYSVTGADGSFKLTDVLPGAYKVEVWHETLGAATQEVTVKPGETTQLIFELAAK